LTSPGPIGSVAPNTGAFTTLSATGVATLPHIHGSLAGNLYIHVKNTSGGQLTRGTPVYIVGNVGDTDRVEVAAADFDDATKMPAVGLLEQTLANNGSGDAIILGELDEANTNAYTINTELYVGNNGALTSTRPTTGQVQSVGVVARVNSNTGVIVVNMQGQRSPNEAFAAASHTHAASAITDLKSAGYAAGLWDNGPEPEGNKVGLTIEDGELRMNDLAFLRTTNLTSPRIFEYPDASGTLALNPMTTAGDIVVGGTSGAPERLALGTASQQLRVNSGQTSLEYFTPPAELVIACSDETTNLTTGTAKVTFRMPYAMTLSSVRASVNTAPTGSTLIVDINEGGSTILSTKLSIDASELTSTTAATAAVISDTALADDAEVTIDIDQIGSTVAGKGLKVVLKGTRA
jgi:hypothetical protein